jgi:hypothetical protein
MKFVTHFTQVSGVPATPATVEDEFDLTISVKCLKQLSFTTTKEAYSGVTMNIPAMQYTFASGFTSTSCPVTIAISVSDDNGGTWAISGNAVYDNLISAAASGSLTLSPDPTTFDSGTAIRVRTIKVTYTNSNTDE